MFVIVHVVCALCACIGQTSKGAFIIKGAKAIVKCSVILYHVYFERQVCVLYLFKLLLFFAIIFIC